MFWWEIKQKWPALLAALVALVGFGAVVFASFGATSDAQAASALTIAYSGGDMNVSAVRFGDQQRAELRRLAEADGSVRILTPTGEETVDLAPRRSNGEIERTPNRRATVIDAAIESLETQLNAIDGGSRDVLATLHQASQATSPEVWVVASPLALQAPADLRVVGLQGVEIPALVNDVRDKGYIPDFQSGALTFLALRAAGEQPAVRPVDEAWLESLWVAIAADGGADLEFAWLPAAQPASAAPSGVVAIPSVDTIPGGCVIDAGVLFQADSAEFLAGENQVRESLAECARSLSPVGPIDIVGHTAYQPGGDEDFSRDLSVQRAERVAGVLITLNVDSGRLRVAGVGHDQPIGGIDPGDPQQRRVEVKQAR